MKVMFIFLSKELAVALGGWLRMFVWMDKWIGVLFLLFEKNSTLFVSILRSYSFFLNKNLLKHKTLVVCFLLVVLKKNISPGNTLGSKWFSQFYWNVCRFNSPLVVNIFEISFGDVSFLWSGSLDCCFFNIFVFSRTITFFNFNQFFNSYGVSFVF